MVNNFYFISLMDIIVVVGTYFQHRARSANSACASSWPEPPDAQETTGKLKELDMVKAIFANISHEYAPR